MAFLAAFCVGFSKTGFSGVSLLAVYWFTIAYGGRSQVGLALPLLIFADVCVYHGFRKHGSWRAVLPLLPPTLVGILGGAFLLSKLDDDIATPIIGSLILLLCLFILVQRYRPHWFARLTHSQTFTIGMGGLGGLTTTLANAAGPIISLYLLARNVPKLELLGLGARFFLLVNLIKIPFFAGQGLITPATLTHNLILAPACLLGVLCGRALIHKIPQKLFTNLVWIFALLAGLRLLL